MAQLKCCSFNCRGWNNGILTLKHYINSLDLCFIQEHWLLSDQLHLINTISSNFLSVSVSGMDSSTLLCGRPFGGCSILYRKSLSSCIVTLKSGSNRFCAIRYSSSDGLCMLFICVYMPSSSLSSTEYLTTLGELDGFINSQICDIVVIVGDFNIDFDRCNHYTSLLRDFMYDLSLNACDLPFRKDVLFTYERDDGLSRSWIDHVLCSQDFSSLITDVHAVHSGSILSDHFPLFFSMKLNSRPAQAPHSPSPRSIRRIDWSKASHSHIEKYCSLVTQLISALPSDVVDCSLTQCTTHRAVLESYGLHLVSTLISSAHEAFPSHLISSSHRRLVGWNPTVSRLKGSAAFWYKVWVEAGCPPSGVLTQIKKNSKKRYKYEVRRLVRRQNSLIKKKLAASYSLKKKSSFWTNVKKLQSSSTSLPPLIDGIAGNNSIANLFASNLGHTLNSNSSSSHTSIQSSLQSSITPSDLTSIDFSEEDVLEAMSHIKLGKSDGDGIFSEHIFYASSVLAFPLAAFFTSILRHGFMPQCLRDCILIPVAKKNKDVTCSSSYRPIALTSSLSKILEHLILLKFSSFLYTSPLQFGFKSGSSTTMCTGVVKNIVSRYIYNGSTVHGCFLDASKAFDLVDHSLLFQKLIDHGLPPVIVRFLSSWYSSQLMRVRWHHSLSNSFSVSNGVRQGGVLSPILFSVYLDGLLQQLSDSGVGCFWGHLFAGAVCYADDIVLLAPCPSALRILLSICSSYATSHGLLFNTEKTQLICFHLRQSKPSTSVILFNNAILHYSDEVTHLGHILTADLNDRSDILRVVKDLNRKSNSMFCIFHATDPFVKSILFKSYCLSLYGCSLWSLSSTSIKICEIALNKLLRKLWHLPFNSHTAIVHCVAHIIDSISAIIFNRFLSLLSSSLSSSSFVRSVFSVSSNLVYSFTGFNKVYGYRYLPVYSSTDISYANFICNIRRMYGYHSPCEDLVSYLSSL